MVSQPAVDPTLTVWESVVGLSLICDIINLEITTGIRYSLAQMTLYLSNTSLEPIQYMARTLSLFEIEEQD